jgi:hypothetical protein
MTGDGKARNNGKAKKLPAVQAWLVGAAATLGAATTLITNIGSVRDALCTNMGVYCRQPGSVAASTADTPPLTDLSPYGVELTALTDPVQAVRDTDKARSVAPAGAEIRLYKRMTRAGTVAWAPVIIYTDSSVASYELARFRGLNDWDPDLVTIRTWCPKARPISSPTGTPVKVAVIDCT